MSSGRWVYKPFKARHVGRDEAGVVGIFGKGVFGCLNGGRRLERWGEIPKRANRFAEAVFEEGRY